MTRSPGPDRIRIADLHPTQITLGLREVAEKRRRWRARTRRGEICDPQPVVAPVVLGPAGTPYLIDRHHLLRAVSEEGVGEVHVLPVADFSAMSPEAFWRTLDAHGWCHPYDAQGCRRPFGDIPEAIAELADDPYRSLASALRRAGGFRKKPTPYSEFAWADFLRHRVSSEVLAADFDAALRRALVIAGTSGACDLPGWSRELALMSMARGGRAPTTEALRYEVG
jgi:hypothetical protein